MHISPALYGLLSVINVISIISAGHMIRESGALRKLYPDGPSFVILSCVLMLSIFDFVLGIDLLSMFGQATIDVKAYDENPSFCSFAGWLLNVCAVGSFMSHFCCAYFFTMLLKAVHPLTVWSITPKFQFLTAFTSILVASVPLFSDGYGIVDEERVECWVTKKYFYWVLYLPCFAEMCFSLYLLWFAKKKLDFMGTHGKPPTVFRTFIIRFVWLYIFTWTVPLVARVLNVIVPDSIEWSGLWFARQACVSVYGFANFMVWRPYARTLALRKHDEAENTRARIAHARSLLTPKSTSSADYDGIMSSSTEDSHRQVHGTPFLSDIREETSDMSEMRYSSLLEPAVEEEEYSSRRGSSSLSRVELVTSRNNAPSAQDSPQLPPEEFNGFNLPRVQSSDVLWNEHTQNWDV